MLEKQNSIIKENRSGKDGKKVLTDSGTVIGVIDNGVLITLKKSSNLSPLLTTTWEKITDTWEFIYPTPKSSKTIPQGDTGDSGNVLEEE